VKFDQKIQTMLANGKITSEQAAALRKSLVGGEMEEMSVPNLHHALNTSKILRNVGFAFGTFILFYLIFQPLYTEPAVIQNVSETLNQTGKVGEMNKSLATLLSIGIFVVPSLMLLILGYNRLVDREEDVLASWAQVETTYQRRSDLIPNLVSSVKSYMDHEKETLGSITALREHIAKLEDQSNKAEQLTKGGIAKLNDQSYLDEITKEQNAIAQSTKALMIEIENYPNLKASDQFLELQAELEGTENRISTARMVFNEKVEVYNASIRRLPGSLIASLGGFARKAYFKSDEGADKVIKVDLNKDHESE